MLNKRTKRFINIRGKKIDIYDNKSLLAEARLIWKNLGVIAKKMQVNEYGKC